MVHIPRLIVALGPNGWSNLSAQICFILWSIPSSTTQFENSNPFRGLNLKEKVDLDGQGRGFRNTHRQTTSLKAIRRCILLTTQPTSQPTNQINKSGFKWTALNPSKLLDSRFVQQIIALFANFEYMRSLPNVK